MEREYRICTKTIMDTIADPDIVFDEEGECNYVKQYNKFLNSRVPDSKKVSKILDSIVMKIKKSGLKSDYDCIIGMSGGVDSTYTAYYAKKILGLRPLVVHMDNGWNSEVAVSNIEKTLNALEIELCTEVLDWNEFKELQYAFLKASTPDGEIPTDHAIWAVLYKIAVKYNIKYIISGTNARTEGILPRTWAQGHLDSRYIKSVYKKFNRSNQSLKTFPILTPYKIFYYIFIRRIMKLNLLDYIQYSKAEALKILESDLNWVYYGGKHYESVYTRFYQGYWLPKKFRIDKRKAHLSTLICSGEISKGNALFEISKDPYPSKEMEKQDIDFIKKKLNISDEEFTNLLKSPIKSYNDYPNFKSIMDFSFKLYNKLFAHGKKNDN
jgi:N-acetyl sugar amidotransferase